MARLLRDTRDIVEDAAWLDVMLDIVGPELDRGLGVAAMEFDVGDVRSLRIGKTIAVGLPSGLTAERIFTATMQAPPAYVQATYRAFDCATPSEIGPSCERAFLSKTFDYGLRDALCVSAILPNDTGCAIFAGQATRTAIAQRTRDRWRVIIEEIQKLLGHRERLLASRARASRRAGVHPSIGELTATPEWPSLAAKGWRAVRGYNVGARPFVVVTKAPADRASTLTAREREAAVLAASGLPNKGIAYELGISASTVGVLLWRAAHKLGVESRAQLKATLSGTIS